MELEKQGILQPNWMTDNGIKLKPKRHKSCQVITICFNKTKDLGISTQRMENS